MSTSRRVSVDRLPRWVTIGVLVGLCGLMLDFPATRHVTAQSAAVDVRLYVLDGGTIILNTPEQFGLTREQVKNSNFSCPVYLIVHPKGTLIYDTGLGDRYVGKAVNEAWLGDRPNPSSSASFVLVTKTVKSQLEAVGLPASKIDYVSLSHPHVDHIGNTNDFAAATFIAHKGDYDLMFGPNVKPEAINPNYAALKNSKNKLYESGEYDVFGDGTVVFIHTPGHTPGHQSLYVKLARTGGVVLSGDLYHYAEELDTNAMPDREKGPGVTTASRMKLQAFVKEKGAQLWIGHAINSYSKQKHAPEYYD